MSDDPALDPEALADQGGLFAEYKEELPAEWHDTFDALTAQGKSPTGILATIEYVTSDKSQHEAATECGTSEVTIRNLQAAAVALGPIENARGARHAAGPATAADYCTHVADRLGWEEGIEYTTRQGGADGNSIQPRLLKEGWRRLFELVAEAADAGD